VPLLLTGSGEPERIEGAAVSASFFEIWARGPSRAAPYDPVRTRLVWTTASC